MSVITWPRTVLLLPYTLHVSIYCATYKTQVCHYAPVQVRRADQHADDLPNTPSSKMSLIIIHKKFNNTSLYLFYCSAIFFVPLGSSTPTVTKSDLFFPCCVAGVKPRYSWIYHLLLNLKLTYTIFSDMQLLARRSSNAVNLPTVEISFYKLGHKIPKVAL